MVNEHAAFYLLIFAVFGGCSSRDNEKKQSLRGKTSSSIKLQFHLPQVKPMAFNKTARSKAERKKSERLWINRLFPPYADSNADVAREVINPDNKKKYNVGLMTQFYLDNAFISV